MSRKHPQNGPSLSKAPYKKPKPLTDEELAAAQARIKNREEALIRDAAKGQNFSKAAKANGGAIPVRGGNAEAFWSGIRAANEAVDNNSVKPRPKGQMNTPLNP